MSRNLSVILLTLANILFFANFAHAEEWHVARVTQPASFSTDGANWNPIKKNMRIPNSSWIKTGIRGRILLKRDKETIVYRANTMAGIIQRNKSGKKTEIHQRFGRILVDVETRKYKHTSVKTPFLAAVVKGTKFSVFVGARNTKLDVVRGIVEVTNPQRGERVSVTAGQNVSVNRNVNQPLQVNGPGRKATVVDVKTGKPVKSNQVAQSNNGRGNG
ncbi:MAG: FecR domain-containing protein, partial [Hyphomicrobiales bacterium]